MKKCRKCNVDKSLEEFYRRTNAPDGRRNECIECLKTQVKAKYHDTPGIQAKRRKHHKPEAKRRWDLKAKYGLTVGQFDAMLEAQGGRCAICTTDKPMGRGNKFVVDHDHKTGAIRGLLCAKCNSMIGQACDNIDILNNAINYLKKCLIADADP